MTGAGTTSVAWTRESSFADLGTGPTYVYPGRDVQVQDITLQNALQRSRLPDDNEAIEAIAEELEGALAIEYDLVHPWMLTDAFVSDYTEDTETGTLEWSMDRGQMPTSRWFVGVDVGAAVAERELKGAATTQLQVQISIGSSVRVTQTIVYADEEHNTSMTPGSITGGDESPYKYHGADLTLDGTIQKKLQTGTIDITNGGSLDHGWNRKAIDAVAGDANYNLNVTKIATEEISDNVALAYGDSTASTPSSDGEIQGVAADIPISRADGDEIRFALEGVRPNSLSWDNIPPSDEERVNENIQMFADRVTVEADISMANPF